MNTAINQFTAAIWGVYRPGIYFLKKKNREWYFFVLPVGFDGAEWVFPNNSASLADYLYTWLCERFTPYRQGWLVL
jgi:hypothetical protein